jgi:hypothetical protein
VKEESLGTDSLTGQAMNISEDPRTIESRRSGTDPQKVIEKKIEAGSGRCFSSIPPPERSGNMA